MVENNTFKWLRNSSSILQVYACIRNMYLAIFLLLVHTGKTLIISVMAWTWAKSNVYKALVLPAKFFICQGIIFIQLFRLSAIQRFLGICVKIARKPFHLNLPWCHRQCHWPLNQIFTYRASYEMDLYIDNSQYLFFPWNSKSFFLPEQSEQFAD